MSERDEYEVPPEIRAGVWANDVVVFHDPEHVTIDFVRVEPRDPTDAFAVARVTMPPAVHTEARERARRKRVTRDPSGERPRRYKLNRRKPTRAELEALIRWRERALEDARKQLRELYGS